MNEADTRAELIDPMLKESGWGVIEDSKIFREYRITAGKLQPGNGRAKPLIADYVLVYKGHKLAIVEAKSNTLDVNAGVAQAKYYAAKMYLETTYSCNGRAIYQICMKTGREDLVPGFATPQELWDKKFSEQNAWRDRFHEIPFVYGSGKEVRYYQEVAVDRAMQAIAENKQRILLTLATGTGKTFIAFQIAWKLFKTRWNLKRDGFRQPRILFLSDRNILTDQAFCDFLSFPDDALVRVNPKEIKRKGGVPTNGSLFFTIFQTFMSGKKKQPHFGAYPCDYFDFIIIDECHRGGAKDESEWRGILEYFSPAVQLGLTATPKRKDNINTYKYFGEPVYIYSLIEGINDGFLTPFRLKRISTTIDDYTYTFEDHIIEGKVKIGKRYKEIDFNKIIEIRERESKRVQILLQEINQNEKTIIFCATQYHAAVVRDLINQYKKSTHPDYCARVTADDGALGEQYLRAFRDNEKTIPTILTTSKKLAAGVDACNVRNIVLMRSIHSMIEFKQIIGRGTRLFTGKEYFTIYDFVEAYHHFDDVEWDGEPIDEIIIKQKERFCIKQEPEDHRIDEITETYKRTKLIIKLRNGKELEIQHMITSLFFDTNGKPISAEEFLQDLYGELLVFLKSETDLCKIWSYPITRKTLLSKLSAAGYHQDTLRTSQILIAAEKSDLFDVLNYIAFGVKPITRAARVAKARPIIFSFLDDKQKEFIEFVLSKYVETGVEELDEEKLPILLELKYHTISDASVLLGNVEDIRPIFINFQKHLYDMN